MAWISRLRRTALVEDPVGMLWTVHIWELLLLTSR